MDRLRHRSRLSCPSSSDSADEQDGLHDGDASRMPPSLGSSAINLHDLSPAAAAAVDANLTVETALTGRQSCPQQHIRHSAQLLMTVPAQRAALVKHYGGSGGTDETDVADWTGDS